jgi:hypothetical protein
MCIRGINFAPFYTLCLLDFETFPTVRLTSINVPKKFLKIEFPNQ